MTRTSSRSSPPRIVSRLLALGVVLSLILSFPPRAHADAVIIFLASGSNSGRIVRMKGMRLR